MSKEETTNEETVKQNGNGDENGNGNGNGNGNENGNGNGNGNENGNGSSAIEEKTEETTDVLEEMNKKYLLLYAEFDNYRKRTAREKADLIKSGGSDVIKSILPVIDDLERAIRANETASDLEIVKEGFRLIHHKFMNIMQAKGVKAIDIMGKEFNADISEAIANVPAPNDEMKGKVMDVVENGYTMNDTVIRFAKVVVGQ